MENAKITSTVKVAEPTDRPTRKLLEHLEDAMIHLSQSNLSQHAKIELDGLLIYAYQVTLEAKS